MAHFGGEVITPETFSRSVDIHIALPDRMTEGIIVQRVALDGVTGMAANVPPLRHLSETGFDFGNDSTGATDLALACANAILERMDYVGPTHIIQDGSRVYRLAMGLHETFRSEFIEPASGDELRITWGKALGWMRQALLKSLRDETITQETLLASLQRTQDELPDPLPDNELDQAALNRQLRGAFTEMAGDASVLSQFLGMIA